jgi:hypothetical protein
MLRMTLHDNWNPCPSNTRERWPAPGHFSRHLGNLPTPSLRMTTYHAYDNK